MKRTHSSGQGESLPVMIGVRLRSTILFAMTVFVSGCGAEIDGRGSERETVLNLSDLAQIIEIGGREQNDRAAILHRPLDGALLDDEVLILDASAPWLRVFDHQGTFLRAFVASGGGPGETVQPTSMASLGRDGIMINDVRRISLIDPDGRDRFALGTSGFLGRGVTSGCDGGTVAFINLSERAEGPGRLVRLSMAGEVEDTLLALGMLRSHSRDHHPWFVKAGSGSIMFFTEEQDTNRLLEIDCKGEVLREIPIDSVGPSYVEEPWGDDGGIALNPPEPPFPGGFAIIDDRILWSMQVVAATERSPADTVTTITAIRNDGSRRRIIVDGWVQFLDSNDDGTLLFSNTVSRRGRTSGLIPMVMLIDGRALLNTIDSRGAAAP